MSSGKPIGSTAGTYWTRPLVEQQLRRDFAGSEGLSAELFQELTEQAATYGAPLEHLLVDRDLVAEDSVLKSLSDMTGLPVVNLAEAGVDPEVVEQISPRIVAHTSIMPIRLDSGALILGTDKVRDVTEEDRLRLLLNRPVRWVLCSRGDVRESINHYFGIGLKSFLGLTGPAHRGESGTDEPGGEEGEQRANIPRYIEEVVGEAIRAEATDIHVEPYEEDLRIRFRIDGSLCAVSLPEGIEKYGKSIVSGLKVLGQMNVAEHRLPQDGRFTFEEDDQTYDIRMSLLPTLHGEAVNLRILNRVATHLSIEELGLRSDQRSIFDRLLLRPHGIILFTGPTGSGKTTSLYAALASLNQEDRKVITIEDPVEYQIHGITQLQARPDIGFSFSAGLRSILRHDPDVILVGEIRDPETASIATSASLTGHLVFSTLHTNDAVSAITRLIDMGTEPYLVSSSVQGVIAQRLVRRLCTRCREPQTLDPGVLEAIPELQPRENGEGTFYREHGCPHCRFTGFRGRQAIFEILSIDGELASLAASRAPTHTLTDAALRQGLKTLRSSGWELAREGLTTVEEVMRVTREAG
jgi:general secretion pathway protein E/type IV pilus assembly protein PilB